MWDNNNPLAFKNVRDKIFSSYGLVIFKLLNDLLLLLLAFFLLLIIADGILPGIISNYYDPAIVVLLILFNVLLISFLERKINLSVKQKSNKKTALCLLAVLTLLVSNTFFHLNIWLNLFLTLISLLAGYFLYRVFLEE